MSNDLTANDLTALPEQAPAVSFSAFGGPEVLQLADAAVPRPGAGQVLLEVRSAGVNPVDWKIRRGYLASVFPVAFPHIPGLEAAGTVVATGPGVTAWAVGDDVYGPVPNSYAAYTLADVGRLAVKPAGLDWETASGLPVAAEAAYRALEAVKATAGETILVNGASGAVGILAVQLATADGIRVVGTASESNHDFLRSIGAVPVSYGEGVFDRVRAAAPEGVDAVLDLGGGGVLAGSVELLGGTERVVSLVDPAEAGPLGVRFSAGAPDEQRYPEALARVARLVAAGTLQLPIRAALPLAQSDEAQRLSEDGHGLGKIVLLP